MRGKPPIVRCDGLCGEAYPATMLTVVGRYAVCKSELKGIRDFAERERQAELRGPALARSNREALADIVRAEGAYTESARTLRRYLGLESTTARGS